MQVDTNARTAAKALTDFIKESPTAFQATAAMQTRLTAAGYTRLNEGEPWKLQRGKNYVITRNGSALIAFRLPAGELLGFRIAASHGDNPNFKLKENPEMTGNDGMTRLNVESYGGANLSTWFDRPLSVAGRVIVREQHTLVTRCVDVGRDLVMIPSLAIHMNPKVNHGMACNVQKDMLPVFGLDATLKMADVVAETLKIDAGVIMGQDLYVYNRQAPSIWGAGQEFLSSPRLDDLQCAFSSLNGLLAAAPSEHQVAVHCCFDNEEVGSGTKQGAGGTFLKDTLIRIVLGLGGTMEDYYRIIANSLMVSADNAHAAHPNYPEKADPVHRPRLNGGVVIKHSANQKYTTDGVSSALVRMLCEQAGVPYQVFVNRSDMPGGSTLGNISTSQVSLNTADVGIAQLAMHSAYETCGVLDTERLTAFLRCHFESGMTAETDGRFRIAEESHDKS